MSILLLSYFLLYTVMNMVSYFHTFLLFSIFFLLLMNWMRLFQIEKGYLLHSIYRFKCRNTLTNTQRLFGHLLALVTLTHKINHCNLYWSMMKPLFPEKNTYCPLGPLFFFFFWLIGKEMPMGGKGFR